MNRLIAPPLPQPPPSALSQKRPVPAPLETARIPSALVRQAQRTMLHETFRHSGTLRERMQALQIQPLPTADHDPEVAVYSTDTVSHAKADCLLNTIMVSAAHSAAIDLHNLACTVEPVPPLAESSEKFGVAFFAQTQSNAGAALRLRDTIDCIASSIGLGALNGCSTQPAVQLVHQMINPFPSVVDPAMLLPVEVVRIRFHSIEWAEVQSLLADALRSLPLSCEEKGRRDVFTLTLSGR